MPSALLVTLTLAAGIVPSPVSPRTVPQLVVDLFWAIHQVMPDLGRAAVLLEEAQFNGGLLSDDESFQTVEMQSDDGRIGIVIDRTDFGPLGFEVGYTVTIAETNQDFAARVAVLVSKLLGNRVPGPLPEQYETEGWETVSWPGEDDGAQMIYAVGYSGEYGLTNIWGSQLHIQGG